MTRDPRATRAEILDLVPGGLEPPATVPPEIFAAALATYIAPRRLDMRALAGDLGISRATLYRRSPPRDVLLGEICWFATRHLAVAALQSAAGLTGRERILAFAGDYMRQVREREPLRRFLAEEPETALRVLTGPTGPVQNGVVTILERALSAEMAAGALEPWLDPHSLAYVLTRIAEGFLFADAIGHGEPDVERAIDVWGRLLR